MNEIEKVNVPPVKYLVITHAHWDHFLGMNEFNVTIIVNSLTNQLLNTWRSYSFDDHSLHEYVDAKKMTSQCVEIIKNEVPNRDVYDTTKNSLFHFKKSKLMPMIEDIQKFDASHCIAGHESICDIQEMDLYWKELTLACKATNSMRFVIYSHSTHAHKNSF